MLHNAYLRIVGTVKRMRTTLMLVLALATTSALAESVIYRGIFGEPESLDPARSALPAEIAILNDLFEGLTSYDPQGKVGPGLAESWQVSEDGLSWRFKLRQGLKWSDGEPLTADDFVFSFRRLVTPATAAPMADRLLMLRNAQAILNGAAEPTTLGVSAPSPDEVLMELDFPAPTLPTLLLNGVGFPTPRHAIERWGPQWTQPGRMAGSGAYMLAERRPGERIRLTKNPHFSTTDESRIDTVVYIVSDNVDTQVNRFRAGELDINRNPGFPPNRKAFLEDKLGTAVRITPYPLLVSLRFNLRREPFDNLDVRRALGLAIDRNKIAKLVLNSGEQPAYHLVPPMISNYEPVASPFNEGTIASRLAIARQLMAAAGYSKTQPLTLNLRFTTGWARQTCIAIAAMWREIGVQVTLQNSEAKVASADVRNGDFDVAYDGSLHQDPEQFLDKLRADGIYNTGAYRSEAFSAALAAARREPDAELRYQHLREAETIALADVPMVPIVYSVSRSLVAPSVRGWYPNPMDIHLTRHLWLEE
jgi:oligopeptide transport system substrate-binding protein